MFALLLFYGSVVRVLSNKVPLKSADYDIQWTTFDYQTGEDGGPPSLRFHVRIFNRHESLGLEVENATLLLNLDGRYLGEAGVNIPYVAPKQVISVPVEFKLRLSISEMAGIAAQERRRTARNDSQGGDRGPGVHQRFYRGSGCLARKHSGAVDGSVTPGYAVADIDNPGLPA